jgi:hypothetical protein
VPDADEPKGDLGEKGKTWSPPADEQGISNRAGDEDAIPEFEDLDVGGTIKD